MCPSSIITLGMPAARTVMPAPGNTSGASARDATWSSSAHRPTCEGVNTNSTSELLPAGRSISTEPTASLPHSPEVKSVTTQSCTGEAFLFTISALTLSSRPTCGTMLAGTMLHALIPVPEVIQIGDDTTKSPSACRALT
ncbi:MAG: hypothetical protein BWY85_01850 [Firmicutes bacterium ADurb.Bin506]|nr:MAG: hypothetical protein BWY85_01850 [Firmicutes bacterium ADurb.Bin506]